VKISINLFLAAALSIFFIACTKTGVSETQQPPKVGIEGIWKGIYPNGGGGGKPPINITLDIKQGGKAVAIINTDAVADTSARGSWFINDVNFFIDCGGFKKDNAFAFPSSLLFVSLKPKAGDTQISLSLYNNDDPASIKLIQTFYFNKQP